MDELVDLIKNLNIREDNVDDVISMFTTLNLDTKDDLSFDQQIIISNKLKELYTIMLLKPKCKLHIIMPNVKEIF